MLNETTKPVKQLKGWRWKDTVNDITLYDKLDSVVERSTNAGFVENVALPLIWSIAMLIVNAGCK